MLETLAQLGFYGPRGGALLLGYALIMLGLVLLVLVVRRQEAEGGEPGEEV